MQRESSEERVAEHYDGKGPRVLIRYVRRGVVEAISKAQEEIDRKRNKARFVEETYKHLDSLTPEEFAREFASTDNETRTIMKIRLQHYDPNKRQTIEDRVDYFSTPEGQAELAKARDA